jgi:hypothetical protein
MRVLELAISLIVKKPTGTRRGAESHYDREYAKQRAAGTAVGARC